MVHWRDFTKEEQLEFGDGCGIHPYLSVDNLIWCDICKHHDFRRIRGTGWDWNQHHFLPYSVVRWLVQGSLSTAWTDILFLFYMLKTALPFWWKPLQFAQYVFMAAVYFVVVLIFGQIPSIRRWCRYRTKAEIVEYDILRKKKY